MENTQNPVNDLNWRKSRRSFANGNCVETANTAGAVLVRDTADRTGPVLTFTPRQWAAFTRSLGGTR